MIVVTAAPEPAGCLKLMIQHYSASRFQALDHPAERNLTQLHQEVDMIRHDHPAQVLARTDPGKSMQLPTHRACAVEVGEKGKSAESRCGYEIDPAGMRASAFSQEPGAMLRNDHSPDSVRKWPPGLLRNSYFHVRASLARLITVVSKARSYRGTFSVMKRLLVRWNLHSISAAATVRPAIMPTHIPAGPTPRLKVRV